MMSLKGDQAVMETLVSPCVEGVCGGVELQKVLLNCAAVIASIMTPLIGAAASEGAESRSARTEG